MIFKTKGKKEAASVPTPPSAPQPVLDGRAKLRHFAAELVKASDAVAELEARIGRLTSIIKDADAANTAVQQAIADDGGVSLEAYAANNALDSPIAKLIATKEAATKAAAEAKIALPNVEGMLARARSEVGRLENEKEKAALAYLKWRADDFAHQYRRIFNALCRAHDQLVGISVALPQSGEHGGEIRMSATPVEVPRFNLPSTADPNEYLPMMTHVASEITVAGSRDDWLQARERLAQDVDADLDDLIGPPLEKAIQPDQ